MGSRAPSSVGKEDGGFPFVVVGSHFDHCAARSLNWLRGSCVLCSESKCTTDKNMLWTGQDYEMLLLERGSNKIGLLERVQ